jgi:ParB family chromosome partitioning protein
VSTKEPNSRPSGKPSLIKESPFARLTQRTENTGEEALKAARLVDINRIHGNPNNPRKSFDDKALRELTADIQAHGILHPPIVRPVEGAYEIVVGERRYRAAKAAGMTKIPVIIQELSDSDARIISLVENIQREDLSFEDEARYFEILNKEYKYSLRQIAELVNKSKSYVDARLTLLKHPAILQQVQQQKLGLHEATLLARLGLAYNDQDEPLESVREKDSSATVREKDNSRDYTLVQPFRQLTDLIKNSRRKIDKTSEDEKLAILRSIETLENELQVIKERIHGSLDRSQI